MAAGKRLFQTFVQGGQHPTQRGRRRAWCVAGRGRAPLSPAFDTCDCQPFPLVYSCNVTLLQLHFYVVALLAVFVDARPPARRDRRLRTEGRGPRGRVRGVLRLVLEGGHRPEDREQGLPHLCNPPAHRCLRFSGRPWLVTKTKNAFCIRFEPSPGAGARGSRLRLMRGGRSRCGASWSCRRTGSRSRTNSASRTSSRRSSGPLPLLSLHCRMPHPHILAAWTRAISAPTGSGCD